MSKLQNFRFWTIHLSPVYMIKTKLALAPIGWKKAGPPKKPILFWSCKQVTCRTRTSRAAF